MKKCLFTLLLAVLATLSVQAQASFIITPNPASTIVPPDSLDAPADAVVKNLSTAPVTLRWTRQLIQVPAGVTTQVCDPNLCWLPSVSSKTFTLAGGQSGELIVHFLNPNSVPVDAIVHLRVNNEADPNQVVTGVYNYSMVTSSVKDLPKAIVKLYPNPVADVFTLENADEVALVRVFSLDNRLVAEYQAKPGMTYSIAGEPAGTYVLALSDDKGRLFQALELIKQ